MKGPNKGFIRELSRGQPRKEEVKTFSYPKAVVPPSAKPMAVPYRQREFKSVKESKTNIKAEFTALVKKRRGEE